MEDGNFSGCRCDRTNFSAAVLNRATFEDVTGEQVDLKDAALNQLRAGAGVCMPKSNFRRASGVQANWAGADLRESDFILAEMPGSDFSTTDLTGCDCRTAELKRSTFNGACLRKVRFNRANLLEVRMEEADLGAANFKGSNLYGSEFLNATIDSQTNFEAANLRKTKLAGLMSKKRVQ
jgi:uncharacterized protein YjbI with pentapeptide repeats